MFRVNTLQKRFLPSGSQARKKLFTCLKHIVVSHPSHDSKDIACTVISVLNQGYISSCVNSLTLYAVFPSLSLPLTGTCCFETCFTLPVYFIPASESHICLTNHSLLNVENAECSENSEILENKKDLTVVCKSANP